MGETVVTFTKKEKEEIERRNEADRKQMEIDMLKAISYVWEYYSEGVRTITGILARFSKEVITLTKSQFDDAKARTQALINDRFEFYDTPTAVVILAFLYCIISGKNSVDVRQLKYYYREFKTSL